MVIVLNMESGERIEVHGLAEHTERDEHVAMQCPAVQPYPPLDKARYVMPALMEHDFSKPGNGC